MSYETKNIRNVCLLGHGGSGKTTLAESMLYMTGAIDRQGKTADGNTVCDYDPEEIKRQITISTSIAPVNFGGCKINILDCPGFFDFAGDARCALRAAEAGIIFCTAKDGIAVGAERSWKYLKNANMPCMFYVSKTNEDHGDFAAVLSALQEKHGSAVCAVTAPMSDGTGVIDLVHNVAYQTNGNKTAKVAVPAADADMVESLRETLFEAAAGADEALMEKYFEDMMLSEEDTVKGLRQGLKDRTVFPVLCGAADSGIGTEAGDGAGAYIRDGAEYVLYYPVDYMDTYYEAREQGEAPDTGQAKAVPVEEAVNSGTYTVGAILRERPAFLYSDGPAPYAAEGNYGTGSPASYGRIGKDACQPAACRFPRSAHPLNGYHRQQFPVFGAGGRHGGCRKKRADFLHSVRCQLAS